MDAAKNAVKSFISKDGKHDTTVHEKVNPAVTNETVTRQQEDRITTAVDKEVHQDHYHTSVQPVNDTAVLPEKHHHNLVGVEHRSFEHDSPEQNQQKLAAEQARFKDTTRVVDGEHRTTVGGAVAGEHVHHHVHENIQPVVNKQTVEPHVVHTTVPIHEVHHNAAQHHSTSALPAMSMSEFKSSGGALTGRGERSDHFEGCPRPGHASVAGTANSIDDGHSHGTKSSTTTGTTGTGQGALAGSRAAGHSAGSGSTTGTSNTNTGLTGAGATTGNSSTSSGLTGQRQHDVDSALNNKNGKPSMMDKMNPKIDADGDGKAGFMK